MRVPNETTVAWRMAVPPSSPTATTVIRLPPRASGTVASNEPSETAAVTTSPPTPTYTVSASVVPRTVAVRPSATAPSCGAVSASAGTSRCAPAA